MRILFVVERPTQFEAPLFQYVARHHRKDRLEPVFTVLDPAAPVYDPELRMKVDWGLDLLKGYAYDVVPPRRHRRRWRQELAQDFKRRRWDLVITNGYKQSEYRLVRALARKHGIAVALRLDADATGSSRLALAAKQWLYGKFLARRYDLFLGVGKRTTDFLARCGIDAKQCASFPYAVDVDYFRTGSERFLAGGTSPDEQRAARRHDFGVPRDAKLVLAVAKLNPRESPEDLVCAMKHLDGDVWLLVAGKGDKAEREDDLEQLAETVAPGRVRFPGYVRYPELPVLYAIADVFVHAAREEHWGVSVAEALACGLPAIASSGVGAGRDLIRHGCNGYVYQAGDAHELADRIKEALRLDRGLVKATNSEVLESVGYRAAWKDLRAAAKLAHDRVAEREGARPRGRRP